MRHLAEEAESNADVPRGRHLEEPVEPGAYHVETALQKLVAVEIRVVGLVHGLAHVFVQRDLVDDELGVQG